MLNISPYVLPGLKDFRTIDYTHTVSDVITMICGLLKYDLDELKTNSRKQELVFRRCIIMKKLRDYHYTTTDIGKFFDKDHSTVIYNSTEIFESIFKDDEYLDDIRCIENFILCKRKPKIKKKTKRYTNAKI